MNGKLKHQDTPEGRLAALYVVIADEFEEEHLRTGNGPKRPDVADLVERIQPYVWQEILYYCLRQSYSLGIKEELVIKMVSEFYSHQMKIPRDYRL